MSEGIKREITDPREMRVAIGLAARGFVRVDGAEVRPSQIAPASALIHAVQTMARVHGLSGEDAMTVLAYEALRAYEGAYDKVLRIASATPMRLDIL